ncbi:phosphatase PAP2 family protein [Plebeiibacterium sediminum]|uniref:Phosphatase PAP2 family protein n=1 Tax=Plebeiibacterium sediminum TaxID=2992112 RepID=A0AAE3M251_9BACT|nr:phosphatase PAP2 family protein [Plebeiobacterium sediminum]MCW3785349.1 phosphatase PAP2 family protein [Plebeiobacterium sediminum]
MNKLIEFDSQLLQLINYFHTDFWDNAFWMISSIIIWIPLYAVILYAIIKSQKAQSWITILALIILVVLCDQISHQVFKHGFERLRPTHDPLLKDFVKIIHGYRGGKYGFVSSHATNTMGLAVLSSLLFRNKVYSIFIFIWALVISYSRIYLGVHYPGDVVGGLILGALIGFGVYKLYKLVIPRFVRLTFFNKKGLNRGIAEQFDVSSIMLIVFAGIFSFVVILLAAKVMMP